MLWLWLTGSNSRGEDGQALISLTYEINNDSTIDAIDAIDVEFSVAEVLPALLASEY